VIALVDSGADFPSQVALAAACQNGLVGAVASLAGVAPVAAVVFVGTDVVAATFRPGSAAAASALVVAVAAAVAATERNFLFGQSSDRSRKAKSREGA